MNGWVAIGYSTDRKMVKICLCMLVPVCVCVGGGGGGGGACLFWYLEEN